MPPISIVRLYLKDARDSYIIARGEISIYDFDICSENTFDWRFIGKSHRLSASKPTVLPFAAAPSGRHASQSMVFVSLSMDALIQLSPRNL